jgi:activator of HSP90 ATPase
MRAKPMLEPIHQEVSYDVDPASVYEALTSSEAFSQFTKAAADIDARDGGRFSCFDDQIVGRNIELVAGERLVQAWRVAAWAAGQYSIVRFTLTKKGSGTQLALDHSGFPDGAREHLAAGWPKMYFEPPRAYLGGAH